MQFSSQPQVAQHQTCLRRKAVQQLLLYRRQPLTLAFLDDKYAQQLASVADRTYMPASHRGRIVREVGWGWRRRRRSRGGPRQA